MDSKVPLLPRTTLSTNQTGQTFPEHVEIKVAKLRRSIEHLERQRRGIDEAIQRHETELSELAIAKEMFEDIMQVLKPTTTSSPAGPGASAGPVPLVAGGRRSWLEPRAPRPGIGPRGPMGRKVCEQCGEIKAINAFTSAEGRVCLRCRRRGGGPHD